MTGPGRAEYTHACGVACFALAFRIEGEGGDWYIYRPSMVFINSANYMSYYADTKTAGAVQLQNAGGMWSHAVHADVPLMAFFEFTNEGGGSLPIRDITDIAVVTSLVNVADARVGGVSTQHSPVHMKVLRSSIQAFSIDSKV